MIPTISASTPVIPINSAFYGGETAADHTKGWGSILDKLAAAPGPA